MTGATGTTGSPSASGTAARLPDIVVCEAVSRTFGSGPTALVAVQSSSCRVTPSARIAIVGASGSGKSTLIHLMAGLDHPTTGQVSWPALAATHQPPLPNPRHNNRQNSGPTQPVSAPVGRLAIGVVFQSPSLIPALTVLENVALPRVLAGDAPADATDRAGRALARLELTPLAGKLPEELSGGQAQRVAAARVLAQAPRLILADEPTGQLDSRSARHLIDVLLRTATQTRAALIVATHDPVVAGRFPRQWQMHDGKLNTTDHDIDHVTEHDINLGTGQDADLGKDCR